MYQKWRNLGFLHSRCAADVVQAMLPARLVVDTFDGDAWIGLIPFYVEGARPRWMPPLPGLSNFPEINVRTYVHVDGADPGIWFFSLDAPIWLDCQLARLALGLPYFHAKMAFARCDQRLAWHCERNSAMVDLEVHPTGGASLALPGDLEFFLIERYLLYTLRRGKLLKLQVHHPPYEVQPLECVGCEQSLLDAANLPGGPWDHRAYSRGVDVEFFRPTEV